MNFVALQVKRNRGWPRPEDSWGLTPMFGSDGWCRSCGTPLRSQCGSLLLSHLGFRAPVLGGWVPNWRFDVICLDAPVADVVREDFNVELRDVDWSGSSPGEAKQIVIPVVGDSWYDPEELREVAERLHGKAGASCPTCGIWRWMPIPHDEMPPFRATSQLEAVDIGASPEWFGDGSRSFRRILVRYQLAELLVAASPKDFVIVSVR